MVVAVLERNVVNLDPFTACKQRRDFKQVRRGPKQHTEERNDLGELKQTKRMTEVSDNAYARPYVL